MSSRTAGGDASDRARLAEIVEASSDYVATTDLFGNLLFANTAFRERFTIASADDDGYLGTSLFGFFTEASRERFMRDAVSALWKVGHWSGEIEGVTPTGETVPLWQSAIAHRGPDGRPLFFSGIAHDMSAIKAADAEVRASEQRFSALLAEGSDVILVVAADGLISYASPAIERILGYRTAALTGSQAFDLIHPDDVVDIAERFATTISGTNARAGAQCRVRHCDGSWRWVELFATDHLATAGINGLIVNGRDITARHDAQDELVSAAELLSSVMRSAASEAIIVTDRDAEIVAFSRGAEYLLGYTAAEVVGRIHPSEFHPAADVAALAAELDVEPRELFVQVPPSGQSLVREWTFVRKDGSTFDGSSLVSARYDHDGTLAGFLYLAADISERRQREAALNQAAGHDSLTGLANRSSLQRALGVAVTDESWHSPGRVLLFIDLDRFKQVNDTLGHAAGDAVLIEVARRLNQALRAEDLAVRLGGDEFVVLLAASATIAEGAAIAERLVTAIGREYAVGDKTITIGASIGISLSRHDKTPEQLLLAADGAAYQAKHDGRGRAVESTYFSRSATSHPNDDPADHHSSCGTLAPSDI